MRSAHCTRAADQGRLLEAWLNELRLLPAEGLQSSVSRTPVLALNCRLAGSPLTSLALEKLEGSPVSSPRVFVERVGDPPVASLGVLGTNLVVN